MSCTNKIVHDGNRIKDGFDQTAISKKKTAAYFIVFGTFLTVAAVSTFAIMTIKSIMSVHELFLFGAIFFSACVFLIFIDVLIFSRCIFQTKKSLILASKGVNDSNTSIASVSNNGSKPNLSIKTSFQEKNYIKLQKIGEEYIRNGSMAILTFTLFGAASLTLYLSNNPVLSFISIGIVFTGFILQLSSTAIGAKSTYSSERRGSLFCYKLVGLTAGIPKEMAQSNSSLLVK